MCSASSSAVTTSVSSSEMKHPAKYSASVLDALRELLEREAIVGFVLDPFAGTGRIHDLAGDGSITLGVELEPEWAAMHPDTRVGDATDMDFIGAGTIHAIVTSPPYANRMADKDFRESAGANYAKYLGRVSSEGSANHMQWGDAYREFLCRFFAEAYRVLAPGGKMFFNISDHYRDYALQGVPDWCKHAMVDAGFRVCYWREVATPRFTCGANAHRPDCEYIIVVEKP